MKTLKPTLKVNLLTQPNKEGLYPIVICAHWNGRAEKRTGVAIPKSAWSPRARQVSSTYPNAKQLNSIIMKAYNEALQRKIQLENSGYVFTVHDIFKQDTLDNWDEKLNYHKLVEAMAKDRGLSHSTYSCYIRNYNVLCQFMGKKVFSINELDDNTIQAYGRWMADKGLKNSTIIERLYNICNIWNYAISKKYVGIGANPFIFFNPRKHYKADVTKKAISCDEYKELEIKLYKLIRKNKSNMSQFSDHCTDEFALAMYVLGYRFGGLAFVDMVNLRKDQIMRRESEGIEYYAFKNVRRQKTNHPVPILVRVDDVVEPLIEYYLSTQGQWLFPLDCHTGNEVKDNKLRNSISHSLNNHLKAITGKDTTYYSCRHTFATNYINAEGSNPAHLATLMGRSVNGIFRYVTELSTDKDILHERQRMGL